MLNRLYVPVVEPAGMIIVVAEASDVARKDAAEGVSNVRLIVAPPAGAGPERVIVPVDDGGLARPCGSPPGIGDGANVMFVIKGSDSLNLNR